MATRRATQLWLRLRLWHFSMPRGPTSFYFALLNAAGSYLNTFSIRAAAVITQSSVGQWGEDCLFTWASHKKWKKIFRFATLPAILVVGVLWTSSIFYNKAKFQEEKYKNVQPKLSQEGGGFCGWPWSFVGVPAYWSVLIRLGISLEEREISVLKSKKSRKQKIFRIFVKYLCICAVII